MATKSNISYLRNLYSKHRNIILYGLIGGSGALLDLLVYVFLVRETSIEPSVASYVSVSFGIVNNFMLNAFFNFKKRDELLYRFASFYSVGAIGAIISAIMIWGLTSLGIGAIYAKLLTIVPIVLAQYLINKRLSFKDSGYSTRYKMVVRLIIYALPILVISAYTWHIFHASAIGYDDGYNLQVSSNLAHYGIYATNGSQFDGDLRLFDYFITTGPTLLVPTAIAIDILGNTIFASRVVPFLVYLAFIWTIYSIVVALGKNMSHLQKYGFAVFAISYSIIAASTENILVSVVGELLAVTLLLQSFLQLARNKYSLSALLIGLAILTKTITAISIPVTFAYLLLVNSRSDGLKSKLRDTAQYLALSAIPLLVFELYRFISFGGSLKKYLVNVSEQITFFLGGGSGLASAGTPFKLLQSRMDQVGHLSPAFNNSITKLVFIVLSAGILYIAFKSIGKIRLPKKYIVVLTNPIVFLSGFTGVLWAGWYLTYTDRMFARYAVGMLILLIVTVLSVYIVSLKATSRTSVLASGLYIAGLIALIVGYGQYNFQFGVTPIQKQDIVKISKFYENKELYHMGWWQNPEVQFLTKKRSLPYRENVDHAWVLLGAIHIQHQPGTYNEIINKCDNMIKLSERYTVCEISKK